MTHEILLLENENKIVKHENLWLTMNQISFLIAHNQDNMIQTTLGSVKHF